MLDLTSPPDARILHAGLDQTGVYRSTDGGATFTQTLGPATPVLAWAVSSNGIGRVAVALAHRPRRPTSMASR